jgi:FMN phosphatase YigB (HAD superfamily)
MKLMDLDLVIFDMDGTLYPDNPQIVEIYPVACMNLLKTRLDMTENEIHQDFQAKKEELGRMINGKPTNTKTLLQFYDVTFEELEDEVDRLINIEDVLQYDQRVEKAVRLIDEHYQIALYTTNNEKCTIRVLEHLKLDEYFSPGMTFTLSTMGRLPLSRIEQMEYIKPGLKGFLMILDTINADPLKTMMVGDSQVSDITPAEKLGMKTWKIDSMEDLYRLPVHLGITDKPL